MDDILSRLALCTFSTGPTMVREVLGDWIEFVGGRPREVIFAVAERDGVVPPIYEELQAEGKIDRLVRLEAGGRAPEAMNAEAMGAAVAAATAEWLLVVKLDTLPYRAGHENWLAETMEAIVRGGFAGLTSCFFYNEAEPSVPGYKALQKLSENFTIIRRADWVEALDETLAGGGYHGEAARRDPRFAGDDHRIINEYALGDWLIRRGKRMLMKLESRDWSVFHVNVWGERLRQVRDSYRKRVGVDKYLNIEIRRHRPPYAWYYTYGCEPPPLIKRIRIALGRWRRQLAREAS